MFGLLKTAAKTPWGDDEDLPGIDFSERSPLRQHLAVRGSNAWCRKRSLGSLSNANALLHLVNSTKISVSVPTGTSNCSAPSTGKQLHNGT